MVYVEFEHIDLDTKQDRNTLKKINNLQIHATNVLNIITTILTFRPELSFTPKSHLWGWFWFRVSLDKASPNNTDAKGMGL